MFSKILIANRGEIACRIIDAARPRGIATVAVFSDADRSALHVRRADEAVHIGGSAASDSYLVGERLIEAARRTGAQAIHPGYGFLSENPDFVEAVEAAGLVFIGPSAASIRSMGLKDAAKTLMQAAGVPVVPGYHGENQDAAFLQQQADDIGYPVLIKARAGGGGKGMRLVQRREEFGAALAGATREGAGSFGDPAVLIEKYIDSPRHIEVQVFGDAHGNVVHLFERDCSLQRRHQKVIEEAPAPGMSEAVRAAMTQAAITAARAIDYRGAGTIEFIVDGSGELRTDGFWFMEMNTRLQVEHPVTEAITGIDLVDWQLRVAAGEPLPLSQAEIRLHGHAFEARLYAEDPANGFLPCTGTLYHLAFGPARIETGVSAGDAVSPFYDPMIAKLITHGDTRRDALQRLSAALADTHVAGLVTNAAFLGALTRHAGFADGQVDTGLIERDLASLVAPGDQGDLMLGVAALALLQPGSVGDGGKERADDRVCDRVCDRVGTPHFRLWGSAAERVRLQHEGAACRVRVERHRDGTVDIAWEQGALNLDRVQQAENALWLVRDGWRCRARYAVFHGNEGRTVSVSMDGETREYPSPDPLANDGVQAGGSDQVRAPMTGSVLAIHVAAGDAVQAGQPLLVLEAMKMEHTLSAPRAGRIADVHVAKGAQVADADVLLELEPESDRDD